MKGKVAKLVRDRGFGFISINDGKEVFFHRSALVGIAFEELEEGKSVEFDTESGPKGARAVNVKVIDA